MCDRKDLNLLLPTGKNARNKPLYWNHARWQEGWYVVRDIKLDPYLSCTFLLLLGHVLVIEILFQCIYLAIGT